MPTSCPFEGLLLVSDLDGTLITHELTTPARNLAAIERFKREGGLFTFATGRSEKSARRFAEEAKPNAPAVVLNGAAIYRFDTARFVRTTPLPKAARRLLYDVLSAFPDVGAEVYLRGEIVVLHDNFWTRRQMKREGVDFRIAPPEETGSEWLKLFFTAPEPRIAELARFLAPYGVEGMRFVHSEMYYYEVLAEGASKGKMLRILAEHLGVSHENTFAIGDYYNDLDLLQNAALGFAPAGAPDEIKKRAGAVVCRCEEGAVADAVEYLARRFGDAHTRI